VKTCRLLTIVCRLLKFAALCKCLGLPRRKSVTARQGIFPKFVTSVITLREEKYTEYLIFTRTLFPLRQFHRHRRRGARLRGADAGGLDGGGGAGGEQRVCEGPGDRAGTAGLPADHSRHFRSLLPKIALLREEDGSLHPAARAAQHQRPEQPPEGETHQLPRDGMRKVRLAKSKIDFSTSTSVPI